MNIIIGAILLCSLAHSVWAQLPEKCALVDCMPPSCPGAYIPRGECCEVCPDCSATFCLMQACAGAFVPPGQCCEVCPSDQCTSNSCQNGGVCYGNPAGGIACACPQGYTGQFCESAAATTCRDIPCQNGGTCRDHFGTYLCECRYGFRGKNCELEPDGRCIHKGEWYNKGQTFFDKCNTCSCSGGFTACTYRGCRSYGCYYLGEWYPVGASYRGDACNNCTCGSGGLFFCTDMTCDQCLHKGQLYNDTQTFFDECNTCRCFKGKVACTKKMCRPDGCYKKGQWYPNGGRFLEDACNYCTCIDGRFGCTDMACNQSCSHKGQVYNHGQSFIDECNSCICSNGAVACTLNMCPPGGCVHKGEWYPSGASFKYDCNLCRCSNGAVACDDQACSKTCVVGGVEYQPGEYYRSACNRCQCQQNGLSICTLIACSVGGCDYQGQWYDNGQSFQDDCNTCTCTDGEVSCSNMECTTLHPCATVRCTRPDCNNPITPPGACCGVCDQGCDVNGRIYKDGQRVHCKERCGDCLCRGGNVELHQIPCPPSTCLNPITPPGQCCPLCQEHED